MLEVTNIVTLDDDIEYVVAGKANYEGTIYYYFVDINDNQNMKILYEDGDELAEVDDTVETNNLLPLFMESLKPIIPEEMLEEARNSIPPEQYEEIINKIKESAEDEEEDTEE